MNEYTVYAMNQNGELVETLIELQVPWIGRVKVETVVPNPDQPRTYFDIEGLNALAESLRFGQEQAVTVIPYTDPGRPEVKWMIDDGERRWRSLNIAEIKYIKICYDPAVTKKNLHASSFRSNWCRAGHTHSETAWAIETQRRLGKSYQDISSMVGKTSATWATNEHALLKLHPSLLALMDPPTQKNRRLPIAVALQLVKFPIEEQLKQWQSVSSLPKSQAYHHVRVATAHIPSTTSTTRRRKPSDNRDYLIGKLRRMLQDSKTLRAFPTYFDNFAGLDVSELLSILDETSLGLAAIRSLIVEASAKTPVPATTKTSETRPESVARVSSTRPVSRIPARLDEEQPWTPFTDKDFKDPQ